MKYVEFKDIENNSVAIERDAVFGVRQYSALNPDTQVYQQYVLLIVKEPVGTIPVKESYEEACKKLGIKI